jgi:hypothetical protein
MLRIAVSCTPALTVGWKISDRQQNRLNLVLAKQMKQLKLGNSTRLLRKQEV